MTSSPRFRATSTVSSCDTSSTRMIRSARSWGVSPYVRSRAQAAVCAAITTLTRRAFARALSAGAPCTRAWRQCKELRRKTVDTGIHCVTGWTTRDATGEGVPIQEILRLAQLRPRATFIVSHCEQGYSANLPLSVLDVDDALHA